MGIKINKNNELGVQSILVEYDAGYISSDLSYKGVKNADLIREFKSGTNIGKDGSLPDVIIVYAVLQKWGIENKNGRIYPKEILERENQRYQEYIKMGTSLGELNPGLGQLSRIFVSKSFASCTPCCCACHTQ